MAVLSFFVWQHHLFVSGINADLRPFYMFSTELISLPTGFVFLCAMGTIWRGRIRFTVPMLFCLAWVFNFLIGGISGVFLSDVPSDVTTHGSFFSMAHFHYTIMGGLVFTLFAAIYYWGPKMLGFKFNETLAKLHFWTMFIAFNATFMPLFALGASGSRAGWSPTRPTCRASTIWVSVSAFVLGLSMLIFLVNLVYSMLIKREPAEANPWHSKSAEWQLPTPVPVHDFDRFPVFDRRSLSLRRARRPARRPCARPVQRELSDGRLRLSPHPSLDRARAARVAAARDLGQRPPAVRRGVVLLHRVRVRVLLPALAGHQPRLEDRPRQPLARASAW